MADILNETVQAHYDAAIAKGGEFTLNDIIMRVRNDPAIDDDAMDTIVASAVAGEVRKVDRSRTKRPADRQLFGDPDQAIPLGEGRRRRRGSMTLNHLDEHLTIVTANRDAVVKAAEVEVDEADLLRPFMVDGKTTWDQARRAYIASMEQGAA